MLTMLAAESDWEDEPKDSEEEDLGALGMSVKDADSAGSVDDDDDEEADKDEDEDEEDGEEKKSDEDEDEPVDGLAALEKMEKELETNEIDVGDEE